MITPLPKYFANSYSAGGTTTSFERRVRIGNRVPKSEVARMMKIAATLNANRPLYCDCGHGEGVKSASDLPNLAMDFAVGLIQWMLFFLDRDFKF